MRIMLSFHLVDVMFMRRDVPLSFYLISSSPYMNVVLNLRFVSVYGHFFSALAT